MSGHKKAPKTQTLSSLPVLSEQYPVRELNKVPTVMQQYPDLFPRG